MKHRNASKLLHLSLEVNLRGGNGGTSWRVSSFFTFIITFASSFVYINWLKSFIKCGYNERNANEWAPFCVSKFRWIYRERVRTFNLLHITLEMPTFINTFYRFRKMLLKYSLPALYLWIWIYIFNFNRCSALYRNDLFFSNPFQK